MMPLPRGKASCGATLKSIDLVVLDLGLPDMDGSVVVERLRSWSSVPIIVLSVRSNEEEKVRLLELGADDYVVKPVGMAELLARARAALRRQARSVQGEPIVAPAELRIDLSNRNVVLGDELSAYPERVPPPSDPGSACRQRRDAPASPQRGLGQGPQRGCPLPSDFCAQAKAQDRGGASSTSHTVNGAGVGYRLSVELDD